MKQPTNRQIETANRALSAAMSAVVEAWRKNSPYPTWEMERDWEDSNPSPRRQHKLLEEAVRAPLQRQADALMLKLRMGEIPAELAHDELTRVLGQIREQEYKHLNLG